MCLLALCVLHDYWAHCCKWQFCSDLSQILTSRQYSIVSETSSVRLRPLSVVLARNAYQLTNIVSQVLQAYMM